MFPEMDKKKEKLSLSLGKLAGMSVFPLRLKEFVAFMFTHKQFVIHALAVEMFVGTYAPIFKLLAAKAQIGARYSHNRCIY